MPSSCTYQQQVLEDAVRKGGSWPGGRLSLLGTAPPNPVSPVYGGGRWGYSTHLDVVFVVEFKAHTFEALPVEGKL